MPVDLTPPPDWYRQYMTMVAANIMDRNGGVRFTYVQLRTALTALEHGENSLVPRPVLELFSNIVSALPVIELSDRQQVTLMLALLNCHMAYHLMTGQLINKDESIGSV